MSNLIRFEFRNMIKQKVFLVCLLINVGFSAIGVLLSSLATKVTNTNEVVDSNVFIKSLFSGGQAMMVFGIFIALFYCLDISDGTMKNIISRGFSRVNVYISKLICSIAGVFIMILASAFVTVILCLVKNIDVVAIDVDTISYILSHSIFLIAYSTIFVFFAAAIFKASGAVVANIFIPVMAPLVLNLGDMLLKGKFAFKLSDIWLDNAATKSNQYLIIVSLIYFIVFFIGGIIASKDKDI